MMEVAGPDGAQMLVQRPWTMEDVKQAMTHLPSPSDVNGEKFAAELIVFWREFRSTTSELGRLLMVKMGFSWAKITTGYPENEVHLTNP